MTEERFRRTFRVPTPVFSLLLSKCKDILTDQLHFGGRPAMSPDKKLAVLLYYLGGKETIMQLSHIFGLSVSSIVKARREAAKAIVQMFLHAAIKWPAEEELETVANSFRFREGNEFPNIVGCLDGCHIKILTPYRNQQLFYNRKKFHSVILSAVCKQDLKFTDIAVGFPGRQHDARCLRESSLWNRGFDLCQQGHYHLIADSAYPIGRWLLTPYRDTGNLTAAQRRFNSALSKRRQVIERAFGMVKRRFRRVHLGIDVRDLEEINILIMSACILNNICVDFMDLEDFDDADYELVDGQDNVPLGLPGLAPVALANQVEGQMKRIQITNNM